MPPSPEPILSEEQSNALQVILTWAQDPLTHLEFKLGGYAGTGKTTLIKAFLRELDKTELRSLVCAFTGKACNVLQRKGIQASTIHSLIYNVTPKENGKVEFSLKAKLDVPIDVIVVDESSMISKDLLKDLRSFNKKLLFVGDPGQLEPVGDNPDLMREPDLVLTKIHRQAESSPIITLANLVRQGGPIKIQKVEGLFVKQKAITSPEFLSVNQVICAKNTTRHWFNDNVRKFLKLPPDTIVPEDKLIVLRNNSDYGVFNGLILFVKKVVDSGYVWHVNCEDEVGKKYHLLPIWKDGILNEDLRKKKEVQVPKEVVWCNFAYCITCHKAQGSEWDRVLVWDEWMGCWDMKRWRYTAITRAAKELIYNL